MDSVRAEPRRLPPLPGPAPRSALPEPALPEAAPGAEFGDHGETPPPEDENLRPPVLRTPALLRLPRLSTRGAPWVDLDVRVDEAGVVSDADWAAGNDDPALVAAAIECALAMKFYPALLGERPVAVWCRQRFEVPRR